jgi:hypothetical protein
MSELNVRNPLMGFVSPRSEELILDSLGQYLTISNPDLMAVNTSLG